MPNPNPRIENLTNAGKGRPKKGWKRIPISLPPELLKAIDALAAKRGMYRNKLIAEILSKSKEIVDEHSEID